MESPLTAADRCSLSQLLAVPGYGDLHQTAVPHIFRRDIHALHGPAGEVGQDGLGAHSPAGGDRLSLRGYQGVELGLIQLLRREALDILYAHTAFLLLC